MKKGRRILVALAILAVGFSPSGWARQKMDKLAKKLLYGDETTRLQAIKDFNKLPHDEQYQLVPDFMVGLTDEDPQVQKISARILKAMGVSSAAEVPPPPKPAPSESITPASAQEQLAEEKKEEAALPDLRKEPPPTSAPVQPIPTEETRAVRGDEAGNYADLKKEIDLEKKGQVTLSMAELQSDAPADASPLSSVTRSLNDPDPWVRSQAARRLAMIHPAPVETIPTLISMLSDKSSDVRMAAAAALGSFGPLAKDAAPALKTALNDPDANVSLIASDALKQIQP